MFEENNNFISNLIFLQELVKSSQNARCLSCYNAAYDCYYSSGSWSNSECTYAYNVCYECGLSLWSVISWVIGWMFKYYFYALFYEFFNQNKNLK